jgi:hypothetical protein
VDALYNIKRKKYKTVCAELAFAKVIFDRMVMIFFIELVMFSLFAMQLDYCNIRRVFDQKWELSLFLCGHLTRLIMGSKVSGFV